MRDDYLFDPSATPDPEIERLEQALAPLRYQSREFRLPPRRPRWRRLALAAAALLVAALLGRALWPDAEPTPEALPVAEAPRPPTEPTIEPPAAEEEPVGESPVEEPAGAIPEEIEDSGDAWYFVRSLEGRIQVEDALGERRGDGPTQIGDRLWCDADTSAELRVGEIGSVQLGADTRLRIEHEPRDEDPDELYRLYLEKGRITASIFAEPRVFQVGTPGGLAVDMGCVYEAEVRDQGETELKVILGVVSFETEDRKVFVPSGASCLAAPGRGPGTPIWDDAERGMRDAVRLLDRRGIYLAGPLERILMTQNPRDSLTLWHLLQHPSTSVQAAVARRLERLSPPPRGVTTEGVLAGDELMRRRWREDLEQFWW